MSWPYPVDKLALGSLMDEEVDLSSGFSRSFNECCFDIKIHAEKNGDEYEVILEISPEEGSKYELIVDYAIIVDNECKFVEKDHWKLSEVLQKFKTTESKVKIAFGISVHQPLISEDVTEKTTFRYFRILCAGETFYINPANMKKIGCEMFDKWFEDEVTHEECSIVQKLAPDDLKLLLTACCGYSTIVVHSRSVFELGDIGVELKIVAVIRAIDAFIRDLRTMHPVRKLECALNYRLTLVADGILRSRKGYLEKLELLHEYLNENGEREEDLPTDVLEMLDVYEDYMLDTISEVLINSNLALFIIFGTIFACLFINGLITLIIAHAMRHSLKWPGKSKKMLEAISEGNTLRLCTVIGSGGHTTEMANLLKQLNPDLFNDRFYIVAETDKLGVDKVMEAEKELHSKKNDEKKDSFEVVKVPRSREVGQSYFSSVFTTLWATIVSIKEIWRIKPDVVLCNGPGTCLPICIISYLFDLFRLRDTRIVFIESICRVKTLSLTGKILYAFRITDFFLVQWQDLVEKYPRTEYIGVLI